MNLIGNRLYIPLIDAVLERGEDLALGTGITIHVLTDNFRETIGGNEAIAGQYSRSIEHMQVALALDPATLLPGEHRSLHDAQLVGIFVAMLIRLTTGIPVDIPFWIDAQDDEICGYGNTQVRMFRTGNRYQYPLDAGDQADSLGLLGNALNELVALNLNEGNKNRVIRASRFAFVGFQIFHVPTRLVNHVTFLEALFSTATIELAHQLSSRIAWYLAPTDPNQREELFYSVKDIYKARSQVVHGSDYSKKEAEIRAQLESVEILSQRVFTYILAREHIALFSVRSDHRVRELQKLGLGIDSEFSALAAAD